MAKNEILVVGSLAYDSIETPSGRAPNALGGSANYFSVGASLFAPVNLVGVVGEDYREKDLQVLFERKVDTAGLQRVSGETFRWRGRYEGDMNEAITLETQLNVFRDFKPHIPVEYKGSPFVFLANIDPRLQMEVLQQVKKPKLVGMDTMNFWIQQSLGDLKKVLGHVDVLLINEQELKDLTGEKQLLAALKEASDMGPKVVVVKRGEFGFALYSKKFGNKEQFFALPAYPIVDVADPTGAGDTFAAGFFGYLAGSRKSLSFDQFKLACVHGCVLASFTIQDFGLASLLRVSQKTFKERIRKYRDATTWPKV